MRFEWDEAKRAINLLKHGIDFAAVEKFDFDGAIKFPDERRDYGETRRLAIGHLGDRLHVLVFAVRGEAVRVTSLRKANERETKDHAKFKTQA